MNPLLKIRFHHIDHSKIRITQVFLSFTMENGNEATGRSPMFLGVMTRMSYFSLCTLVVPPSSLFSTSLNSLPTRLEKTNL